jgi:hypothetical protein
MVKQVQKIIKNHENLINSAIGGGMWLGEKMHLRGSTMSRGKCSPGIDSGWRKDVACREDVSLRMDNG